VTADSFTGGAIGGLSGGDAKCQAAASAAGLPGSYKAWLSAGSESPDVRFTRAEDLGPFRLVRNPSDGADPGPLIANSFAELMSCEGFDDCLQHDIDRTATGAVPAVAVIWTGTKSNGSTGSQTCSEWTSSSNAVNGVVGASGSSSSLWTIIADIPCDNARPLYCFEQSA
jgi:hypothetical protein